MKPFALVSAVPMLVFAVFSPEDELGAELLEYLAAGRGVVFPLPHIGNDDLAGAWIIAKVQAPLPPWRSG